MTSSEEISEYLDNIGYSDIERKRKRDLVLRCQPSIREIHGIDTIIRYVLLGSRVEGSDIVGSDRDFVEVESTSNFFEQACIHTRHDCDACCTIESDASLPGYVMIRNTAKYDTRYSYMYTTRSGKNYLSSKLNIQARLYDARKKPRGSGFVQNANGPSLAITYSRITFDHTHAYVYHCPNIITRWVAARNGDWPPQDVNLKVASLPAFLVPIGQKGAPDEDLQWRICFNLGELVLVDSLNNTQFKVYLILKVLKNILLGTLCKSMTSFLMKNIVFHLCDTLPTESFKPDTLMERVKDALRVLRKGIEKRSVPYFMIPERNLLNGKITDKQQTRLLKHIHKYLVNDSPLIKDMMDYFKTVDFAKRLKFSNMISDLFNVHSMYNQMLGSVEYTLDLTTDGRRDTHNTPDEHTIIPDDEDTITDVLYGVHCMTLLEEDTGLNLSSDESIGSQQRTNTESDTPHVDCTSAPPSSISPDKDGFQDIMEHETMKLFKCEECASLVLSGAEVTTEAPISVKRSSKKRRKRRH